MRKTISRILGLSALLALLPACSPQSDVEEATLDLSTETLTFTKEASEQTLTVSTNKESWSALSPQEATWLSLTQEGNTLKVRAEANDLGNDRVGSVIVNAGGLQKRVTFSSALSSPSKGVRRRLSSRAIPLLRWRSEPKPLGSSSPK